MIFLDPWDLLQEKLEYIIKVMHVDIRDLAECGAVLYQDLEHIEVRLIFILTLFTFVVFCNCPMKMGTIVHKIEYEINLVQRNCDLQWR